MIIGWSSNLLEGQLIHLGRFCLSAKFTSKSNNTSWVCTSVYGPNDRHLKHDFWTEIRHCCPDNGTPWVLCGDFNSIFNHKDKSTGTPNLDDIRQAQLLLSDLHLIEPPSFGKRFTWTNGQSNPLWIKLDRFLLNQEWISLFPKATQNTLPRLGSDHVPIRLESGMHLSVPRPFHFERSWCSVENFTDLIKNWWTGSQPQGCGAFVLAKKISYTRNQLRLWAKTDFGSIKLKKLPFT
ncbi:DNase I-like protein [Dioscorea alata]|uniref:DNase I-like protein n=1 Tax=Dioscorea alata TaxID=55571 RepID=A0ACB7UVL6_DIOAL|nr:DNase I-like protein [Dioscorea alata]